MLCVDLQGNVAANLHDKQECLLRLLAVALCHRTSSSSAAGATMSNNLGIALPAQKEKAEKATTATNMMELFELDGLRGEPEDEQRATAAFRAMSMQQRMQESKTWACWAQG